MRPEISSELIRKAVEKWKMENNIIVDIPTSKILEDILMRFLHGQRLPENVRDRKRDRLMRRFLNVKYRMDSNRVSSVSIKASSKGSLIVNNRKYETSLMVSHNGLIKSMLPKYGNVFSMREFNRVLAENPEIVIIGNGYSRSLQIAPNIMALSKLKGLTVISYDTPKAVKEFNRLLSDERKVVGYFHVL